MIDNTKLSFVFNKFKKKHVDKKLIKSIIDEYQIYPQYMIKYITVYYAKITAECATEYILNFPLDKKCNLIDYVLNTYSIKLCDIEPINEISCIDECHCYSREIWIHIYKLFLEVFAINPGYFFTSINFYNSLTTLVSKTDVLDDNLFDLINNLINNFINNTSHNINPKKYKSIIEFISNVELYSSNYGTIISTIRNIILKNNKYANTFSNSSRVLLGSVIRKYNDMQKNISQITDVLYLSDISIVKNVAILKEKKIQNIVSITKKSIFMLSGIKYTRIMIDDISTIDFVGNTLPIVIKTVKRLQKGKITLVHCYRGLSRSVCFVILVLIHQGMSFDDAYELIKNKRSYIDPNPEFIQQIITYYNSIYFNKIQ